MAWNFGGGVAGVAGGISEIAGNKIKNNQEIDYRRELSDIQASKQMAIEQAQYDKSLVRNSEYNARLDGVLDSVKDPMEGKGGYEDPAKMEAHKREIQEARAEALRKAGFKEEARDIDRRIDAYDRNASGERKQEFDRYKLAITDENAKLRLAETERRLDWQIRTKGAEGESSGSKITATQVRENDEINRARREVSGLSYHAGGLLKSERETNNGYGKYFTKPDGTKVTEFIGYKDKNPEFDDLKSKFNKAKEGVVGESASDYDAKIKISQGKTFSNKKTTSSINDTSTTKPKRSLSSFQQ